MNGARRRVRTMRSTPPPRVSMVTAVMVMLGMALLGTMFVTPVAAEPKTTNVGVEKRITAYKEDCRFFGGTPSTNYDFGADGEVVSAQTSCEGGDLDGRVCTDTATTTECTMPLVAPTESVRPPQRPDTADPRANPGETPPVAGDRAAPSAGVAEDPTAGEQARIVDPAEACRALGGTANVLDQGSRVPVEIRCTGGTLDDMICYGTICDYFRGSTGSEEDPNAPPSGGIVFVEPVSLDDLDHVTGDSVAPEMAEDPPAGETVTIANQSDSSGTGTILVQLCRGTGGKETVDIGPQSVFIRCTGGMLDGLECGKYTGEKLACWASSVTPEEGVRVTPAGGIEAVSEEPGEAAGATGVTPGVAEDPTRNVTLVIANQSGSTVTDNATGQVLLCRGLGGTETVYEDRTVGSGLISANVRCTGGLLDGLLCANNRTYTYCTFRAVLPEDSRVTPAAGIEVPAENAPTETTVAEPTGAAPDDPAEPTTAPTEPPVEPTVAPTEMPAEPTAVPTEEPVLPTVPTDDNTAPPGEAEDPTQVEPTPTEVVLL